MKKRHVLFAAIAAMVALPMAAFATTYYVDPSATSSGDNGSLAKPWKTVSEVNANKFSPGDSILICTGTTLSGMLYFTSGGTAAAPITLGSYSGSHGAAVPVIQNASGTGFYAYNCGGFVIQNLKFNGVNNANQSGSGISFYADTVTSPATAYPYIQILNVEVQQFGVAGIGIGGWDATASTAATETPRFTDILLQNCTVHDNAIDGVEFYASAVNTHRNVQVLGCTFYNNAGNTAKIPSGSGIFLGDVDGGLIQNCLAYNNGASGGGGVGIWTYESNNIVMQYNISHDNHTVTTADGDGFDLDEQVTNSTAQYNFAYNNDGAGYLMSPFPQASKNKIQYNNNTVRYNISQNDGRRNSNAGLTIYGQMNNSRAYNNTIYTSPVAATTGNPSPAQPAGILFLDWDGSNVLVANNILYVDSGATSGLRFIYDSGSNTGTGRQIVGNDYFDPRGKGKFAYLGTTYTSASSWIAATQQETLSGSVVAQTVDPMLTNPGNGEAVTPVTLASLTAYKLKTGSPMVDAGLNLATLFGTAVGALDFYGDTLFQGVGPDIGADEFPLLTYAVWAAQKGLTGTSALPTAVLLPDGLSNLYKYAFGLDPATIYNPGDSSLPKVQIQDFSGTDYLSLSFTGNATDVTYNVQAVNDPGSAWSTVKSYSGSPAPGAVTVQDSQPVSSSPKRVMRLQVQLNP